MLVETPVKIGTRRFVVVSNAAGVVLRIIERKTYEPGRPWERVYDAVVWHHAHHGPAIRAWSMTRQVIDAAKVSYAAP